MKKLFSFVFDIFYSFIPFLSFFCIIASACSAITASDYLLSNLVLLGLNSFILGVYFGPIFDRKSSGSPDDK